MILREIWLQKTRKYIDKILEEKVGNWLKNKSFYSLCKLFVIKQLKR